MRIRTGILVVLALLASTVAVQARSVGVRNRTTPTVAVAPVARTTSAVAADRPSRPSAPPVDCTSGQTTLATLRANSSLASTSAAQLKPVPPQVTPIPGERTRREVKKIRVQLRTLVRRLGKLSTKIAREANTLEAQLAACPPSATPTPAPAAVTSLVPQNQISISAIVCPILLFLRAAFGSFFAGIFDSLLAAFGCITPEPPVAEPTPTPFGPNGGNVVPPAGDVPPSGDPCDGPCGGEQLPS